MEEFGKLFDSDHLSENEPELIELIVGDIILSCDQLGLYSLQWVCQQFCQDYWNVDEYKFEMGMIV